jgi:hypothetical protein
MEHRWCGALPRGLVQSSYEYPQSSPAQHDGRNGIARNSVSIAVDFTDVTFTSTWKEPRK